MADCDYCKQGGFACAFLAFKVPEGFIGDVRSCLEPQQLEYILDALKPTTVAATTTMSPLATQQIVQKEIISVKRQESWFLFYICKLFLLYLFHRFLIC